MKSICATCIIWERYSHCYWSKISKHDLVGISPRCKRKILTRKTENVLLGYTFSRLSTISLHQYDRRRKDRQNGHSIQDIITLTSNAMTVQWWPRYPDKYLQNSSLSIFPSPLLSTVSISACHMNPHRQSFCWLFSANQIVNISVSL